MKPSAVAWIVLTTFLLGCPSDPDEGGGSSPSGHTSGSPDSPENDQAPSGQHEPQVPENEDEPADGEGADGSSEGDPMVIWIRPGEGSEVSLEIDNQTTTRDGLPALIEEIGMPDLESPVVLHADARVAYADVASVIDILNSMGVRQVRFDTRHVDGEESESSEASSEVTVQQLDWDGVQSLVETHRGKVVVIDLWSLSCPPCLAEFPNLVALSQQYPEEVACISVSTDYQGLANRPLDYYEPRVLDFLTDKGATFENVLCTVPKFDLFEQIDINSEPTIIVYNQAGEEAMVFTGPQENDSELSYEQHIVPFVEGLLTEAE